MTTDYIIASDLSGEWLVIDIRGGFECRVICTTDSRGKACWIAGLFNKHGDDRGAPPTWANHDRNNSKPHPVSLPKPEA